MQDADFNLQDNLSNLRHTLVAIEQCEGENYDANKFEPIRAAVLIVVGNFYHTRYALGRILAAYRDLFKVNEIWMKARTEIAAFLGLGPRQVSRIIEAVEDAGDLTLFEVAALAKVNIDPGKPRNLPIIEAIRESPEPVTQEEADAAAARAVQSHRAARNATVKPFPDCEADKDSIEEFAKRMVKICSGRFEHQPLAKRIPELKYVFELVLTSLHTDLPALRKYSSMRDIHMGNK